MKGFAPWWWKIFHAGAPHRKSWTVCTTSGSRANIASSTCQEGAIAKTLGTRFCNFVIRQMLRDLKWRCLECVSEVEKVTNALLLHLLMCNQLPVPKKSWNVVVLLCGKLWFGLHVSNWGYGILQSNVRRASVSLGEDTVFDNPICKESNCFCAFNSRRALVSIPHTHNYHLSTFILITLAPFHLWTICNPLQLRRHDWWSILDSMKSCWWVRACPLKCKEVFGPFSDLRFRLSNPLHIAGLRLDGEFPFWQQIVEG